MGVSLGGRGYFRPPEVRRRGPDGGRGHQRGGESTATLDTLLTECGPLLDAHQDRARALMADWVADAAADRGIRADDASAFKLLAAEFMAKSLGRVMG